MLCQQLKKNRVAMEVKLIDLKKYSQALYDVAVMRIKEQKLSVDDQKSLNISFNWRRTFEGWYFWNFVWEGEYTKAEEELLRVVSEHFPKGSKYKRIEMDGIITSTECTADRNVDYVGTPEFMKIEVGRGYVYYEGKVAEKVTKKSPCKPAENPLVPIKGEWYQTQKGSIICYKGEENHGINLAGEWSKSIGTLSLQKGRELSKEEVIKYLKPFAEARGLVSGVHIKILVGPAKGEISHHPLGENWRVDGNGEITVRGNGGYYTILDTEGNWAEPVDKTIIEPQPSIDRPTESIVQSTLELPKLKRKTKSKLLSTIVPCSKSVI